MPVVLPEDVEEVEARVLRLVQGGDGLCRIDGLPVFVPRTAPGDLVRMRIVERKTGFARAEVVAVLSPGPARVKPRCAYFARCGGCDFQHIESAAQLPFKVEAAIETLRRLGGLHDLPVPRIHASPAWGYRSRVQWHTEGSGAALDLGYFARASRELVAVDRCPVLEPHLEQELSTILSALRLSTTPPRRVEAVSVSGKTDVAPPVEGVSHGEVCHEVLGKSLRYDARCFFQGNLHVLPRLIGEAVGAGTGERVVDLFSGVGLFAVFLAERYQGVTAVETDAVAVRFAKKNVRVNHVGNVEVVASSAEGFMELNKDPFDRIVVDPPRLGLSAQLRRQLIERGAKQVTYVSCAVPTLARDLRQLKESYDLQSLAFLDMFPQTAHLEAVVQLVHRRSAHIAQAEVTPQ